MIICKPSYHLNIQPIKLKFLVVRIIITTILFIPKMVSRRKKQKRRRKKREEVKKKKRRRRERIACPSPLLAQWCIPICDSWSVAKIADSPRLS